MAQKLPIDLLSGLYKPEYEPTIETLNEAEFDPEAIAEALEKEIAQKIAETSASIRSGTATHSKKLTEFESEALDAYTEALGNELDHTRSRINKFKDYINDQVRASSGELSFTMNIQRKPLLKRAIINVFGKKTASITYSMYLEARKAKKEIEERQSDEYLKADWEE
jgi:hypothetical protein